MTAAFSDLTLYVGRKNRIWPIKISDEVLT